MKSIEELLASENIIPERPPSLDAKGRRLDIFPERIAGFFRKWRDRTYTFLLFLFLVVPWTTFDGQQTILIDLANKKFVFFGMTLLAHDGPVIFFVFGMIVFGLLFATALYGRVWCGWACPQTVFIDGLYRKIETWIEGNHIKRKKLASAPWTVGKLSKKSFKWLLFLIVSSHTAHSVVAYFVGAKNLFWITTGNPSDSLTLFLFIQIFTLLIAIDFGWFREQFCLVACPYGRFQSVLMDSISKTVIYDHRRGEPRRRSRQEEYADCVNCFKCVSVCPTGIDIRNGQQLECIACTACIDACDSVMEKLKKPKGLIRYASEKEIDEGEAYKKPFNLRAFLYGTIVALCFFSLVYFVQTRNNLSVKVLRATESPYQMIETAEGEMVSNHFKLHMTNQTGREIAVAKFRIQNPLIQVISPTLPTKINAGEQKWIHVFLKVNQSALSGAKLPATWTINYAPDGEESETLSGDISILGPSKQRRK